jgi:DNA-binding transcriptional MocR family regulator
LHLLISNFILDWQNIGMTTPTDMTDLDFVPDPSLSEPIYQQLAAALSNAIRLGRIAIGSRLPSERLYAEALGVSRTTITAAYQELRALGLLRGYVGRGAIVVADDPDRSPAEAVPWSQLTSPFARRYRPPGVGNNSGLISFGDGWLHSSLTPRAALAASAAKVVQNSDALTKAAPLLGLPALQDALGDTLRAAGVKTSAGEILITGGAQQGLNIIARALLSPGDTVICESPTWHGAVRAFRAAGAEVVGIAMDHEGIDPDGLEDSLARLRPKFVYLIPTFQCPTGRLMGLQRRRRILETCARFRTPIVESHVYGDLAFGDRPPSLKSLDSTGLVIHQGSASKTISAALRLGWLIAPRPVMDVLATAKASIDLSTPALTQAVLAEFLKSGAYARHQSKSRAALLARRDTLIAALAAHCSELRYGTPQGGLYLWAQLPVPLSAYEVEAAAAAEGVSIRGGNAFLTDEAPSSHIRLCFAAPAQDEIVPGAERLGKALRGLLKRHRGSAPHDSALASV